MFKYGIIKSRLTYICFCALTSIVFPNCTTSSQMYLQSAKYTNDVSYGYSISNPILLKDSKSFGSKKIIEEYISRLGTSPGPGSFSIIERETIAIPQSNSVDSLERIKIVSDTETKTLNITRRYSYTLYFKLIKHKQKFYVPTGFMYGYLCGRK